MARATAPVAGRWCSGRPRAAGRRSRCRGRFRTRRSCGGRRPLVWTTLALTLARGRVLAGADGGGERVPAALGLRERRRGRLEVGAHRRERLDAALVRGTHAVERPRPRGVRHRGGVADRAQAVGRDHAWWREAGGPPPARRARCSPGRATRATSCTSSSTVSPSSRSTGSPWPSSDRAPSWGSARSSRRACAPRRSARRRRCGSPWRAGPRSTSTSCARLAETHRREDQPMGGDADRPARLTLTPRAAASGVPRAAPVPGSPSGGRTRWPTAPRWPRGPRRSPARSRP